MGRGIRNAKSFLPTYSAFRILYLTANPLIQYNISIRGVAQVVARLVWVQEVAGSNPVSPTSLMVNDQLSMVNEGTLTSGRSIVNN